MARSTWSGTVRNLCESFRSPVLLSTLLLIAGCDTLFVEPAPRPTALQVSYSLAESDGAIAADAFAEADNVTVTVQIAGQATIQENVAFPPGQTEVRVAIEIPLEGEEATALVTIQLRRGSDSLFSGTSSVVIRQGDQQAVSMPLTPIPAMLTVPSSFNVSTLSETVPLPGTVAFVTGDPIPGASINWTTTAPPSLVNLTPSGIFEAHANGTFPVTAMSGSLSANMNVIVNAQAVVSSVAPAEVAAGSRVVLQIHGENLNNATHVTVCGSAHVEDGLFTVSPDGRIVEVPVTWFTQHSVTGEPQSGPHCVNVHSPQGVGVGSTTLSAPVVGPPAELVFVAGMEQSAYPGEPVGTAPRVRVRDAQGQGVPGVPVEFAPDRGGTVENPTVITNGDGEASPGIWTLGDRPFSDPRHNILTAQVPGLGPVGIFAVVEDPCTLPPIMTEFGAEESGTLVLGRDCFLTSGRLQRRFAIDLPSVPAFQVAVSSPDFPPSIFTHHGSGAPQIDGRGLGSPGTITNEMVLPGGSYRLHASTALQDPQNPTQDGDFSLITSGVSEPGIGCFNGRTTGVTHGSAPHGTLTADDCDFNTDGEGIHWDGYSILVFAGQTVTVGVNSGVDFWSSFWLHGEQVAVQSSQAGDPISWVLEASETAFFAFYVGNDVPFVVGPYMMNFALSGGAGAPAAASGGGGPPLIVMPPPLTGGGGQR